MAHQFGFLRLILITEGIAFSKELSLLLVEKVVFADFKDSFITTDR